MPFLYTYKKKITFTQNILSERRRCEQLRQVRSLIENKTTKERKKKNTVRNRGEKKKIRHTRTHF